LAANVIIEWVYEAHNKGFDAALVIVVGIK
jgi:hypothetical protein